MIRRTIYRTLSAATMLAVVGWGPALADMLSSSAAPPPNEAFTPASSTPTLASLKKFYDIPNFRIGGTYDLTADPETWRNGGQGGVTLESLGAGPLKTAYIDVGTPIRNEAGEIINASARTIRATRRRATATGCRWRRTRSPAASRWSAPAS